MHAPVRRTLPAVALSLALAGLSPATSPSAAAAGPTHVVEAPTAGEVLGALAAAPDALVPATAEVTRARADQVVSGEVSVPRDPGDPVVLGTHGLAVGLPVSGSEPSVVREGVSIFRSDADAASVAVNPLAGGGTQLLVAIGAADSPETYAFEVDAPDGARLELTEDGGARVANGPDTLVTIPAPWARDAKGADVPTHYELVDGALVQVVDHVGSGAAYPILADPSFKLCNLYTAACVTFTKSEVRAISASWAQGAAAGVATACSLIPWSPWYVAAVKVVCVATIGAKAGEFIAAVRSAQSSGKCLEVKWSVVATPFLSGSKVVGC